SATIRSVVMRCACSVKFKLRHKLFRKVFVETNISVLYIGQQRLDTQFLPCSMFYIFHTYMTRVSHRLQSIRHRIRNKLLSEYSFNSNHCVLILERQFDLLVQYLIRPNSFYKCVVYVTYASVNVLCYRRYYGKVALTRLTHTHVYTGVKFDILTLQVLFVEILKELGFKYLSFLVRRIILILLCERLYSVLFLYSH